MILVFLSENPAGVNIENDHNVVTFRQIKLHTENLSSQIFHLPTSRSFKDNIGQYVHLACDLGRGIHWLLF